MGKNHYQGHLIRGSTLLALSGFSFLVVGILWFIGELVFDWIGAGAVGTGCYLIILALKKRR
jgi:hypothetical protein